MADDEGLDESFHGDRLDPAVWFPYYLPHWSSRAQSAATHVVHDGELHLTIPAEQGLWCPDKHTEPLRVSCIQSGSFSGPVGSPIGQQPFRDDLVVVEEQPTMWGYTPHFGRVDVTMRARLTARSMMAFWLAGIEDVPERSGELCVVEVFGDAIGGDRVDVGVGLHAFRDPALTEAWSTVPLTLDVADDHIYGVAWRPGTASFSVDGVVIREIDQAPDYPMQLMIGLFDFPGRADRSRAATEPTVPELVITRVQGRPTG